MAYYHGSEFCLPIGTVLRPRGSGGIEDVLEKARPPAEPARTKSVFAVTDPDATTAAGGSDWYIYEIEPLGRVSGPFDGGWFIRIGDLLLKKMYAAKSESEVRAYEQQMDEAAAAYWSKHRCTGGECYGGEEWLIEGGARVLALVRYRGSKRIPPNAPACRGKYEHDKPEIIAQERAALGAATESGKLPAMAKVQIAYEQAHECKEGCGCAKDSGYLDAVQASLADLGSDDPAGDVARHAKYVRGAQKARLEPKQAAAMILAMSRPDEGYQPRYRFEDVAETGAADYRSDLSHAYEAAKRAMAKMGIPYETLLYEDGRLVFIFSAPGSESFPPPPDMPGLAGVRVRVEVEKKKTLVVRALSTIRTFDFGYRSNDFASEAVESAAHEYIAVDNRGKKVFGPTDSFDEAKLHARRAGGVVKFEMGAKDMNRDLDTEASRHALTEYRVTFQSGGKTEYQDVYGDSPDDARRRFFKDWAPEGATVLHVRRADANETPKSAPASPSGLQPGSRVTIETPLRPAGSGGSGHPKLGYVVKLGKRGALVATADGEEWYPIDRLTADGYVSPDYARELPYDKPIRFHRGTREGTYVADMGHLGRATCMQRPPNRRANPPVLPWVVMIRKVEIAQASTKLEAYGLAAEYAKNPKAKVEEPPAAAECTPVIRNGRVERSPDCGSTGVRLASAKDVWLITKDKYARQGHETFEVLGANLNSEMVDGPVTVAVGQTSGVRVEPEAVIIAALGLKNGGSTQIWCSHPHPGGSPNPSAADRNLDKAIREAFGTLKSLEYKGQVVCTRTTFKRV
ncbi:MAG: JAB domain-containing protein [Acidimicrobiales bacterium]